jgi:predicted NBD/HSP70 family sugar kinase
VSASTSRRPAAKETKTSAPRSAARRKAVSEVVAAPRPLRRDIVELVWREKQISRAEIARRLDLSRSTVSEIVADLLSTRLVAEVGSGESLGGRRPIVLEFQDDAYGILGVDMGASHIGVALTDLRGHVVAWEEQPHPVRTDPTGARALVIELARKCLAAQKGGRARLVGVGVAVPSPVDPRHPDELSRVVLPAWEGRGVQQELRAAFGRPVLVDNDANLGALAESWWGASRGVEDSAYIKVATGVGSGHILAGKIYRGARGTAGEIGHMSIDPHGPVCLCGLRGCLSTFIGTEALVARTRELVRDNPTSTLARGKQTITTIEDAALAGDPLALRVVEEAADYLGTAVAGLLNLMNPAVVSIGGSLARLGDRLILPLRASVRARTLVTSVADAAIVASELGERDVAVGAATLVLSSMLANPIEFPVAYAAV